MHKTLKKLRSKLNEGQHDFLQKQMYSSLGLKDGMVIYYPRRVRENKFMRTSARVVRALEISGSYIEVEIVPLLKVGRLGRTRSILIRKQNETLLTIGSTYIHEEKIVEVETVGVG